MRDIFDETGVGGSVLDIGTGAGNIVRALRDADIQAEGCEFSSSGRKLAMERFGVVLSPCNLRQQLPYEDDQFNWGICVGVLSMIPISYMANAISEILRVIRFGVLVNVQTMVSQGPVDFINPHHLSSLSCVGYWDLFHSCGAYDWTSIKPPQKKRYGIGVLSEFAGLFSKRKISDLLQLCDNLKDD